MGTHWNKRLAVWKVQIRNLESEGAGKIVCFFCSRIALTDVEASRHQNKCSVLFLGSVKDILGVHT